MKCQKKLPLRRVSKLLLQRFASDKINEQNRISIPSSLSTKASLGLGQNEKMHPKSDICTDIIPCIMFVWPQRLPEDCLQASQGKLPTKSCNVFNHLMCVLYHGECRLNMLQGLASDFTSIFTAQRARCHKKHYLL